MIYAKELMSLSDHSHSEHSKSSFFTFSRTRLLQMGQMLSGVHGKPAIYLVSFGFPSPLLSTLFFMMANLETEDNEQDFFIACPASYAEKTAFLAKKL